MRFTLLIALLLAFITVPLVAQNVVLEGTVVDEETGEPIPYAAISTRFNQGSFANETGAYRIEFPADQGVDSVYVSQIGYTQRGVDVSNYVAGTVNRLDLRLRVSIISLDVVEVTLEMDPIYLIKRALRNIPYVYGCEEYLIQAYYREYSIEGDQYAEFTEAMVTIKDQPYYSPKAYAAIYLDNLKKEDYKGQVAESLRHGDQNPLYTLYQGYSNGARRHTLHWMTSGDIDFFEAFSFERMGVYSNGRDTIVRIGFELVPERTGMTKRTLKLFAGWTKGEIYINMNDNAFIKITRGDEDGSSYSESTYHKIRGKYYPRMIQKTSGFRVTDNNYYLNNQTMVFTNMINQKPLFDKYLTGKRVPPKRQFSYLKRKGLVPSSDFDRGMIFLPLSKALEVEKAKRLLNEKLGRNHNP